jgi:hypothetical protein
LQPNDYQPLALSIDQRPAGRDFVASEVPDKERLLANGDRWEHELVNMIASHAHYR